MVRPATTRSASYQRNVKGSSESGPAYGIRPMPSKNSLTVRLGAAGTGGRGFTPAGPPAPAPQADVRTAGPSRRPGPGPPLVVRRERGRRTGVPRCRLTLGSLGGSVMDWTPDP